MLTCKNKNLIFFSLILYSIKILNFFLLSFFSFNPNGGVELSSKQLWFFIFIFLHLTFSFHLFYFVFIKSLITSYFLLSFFFFYFLLLSASHSSQTFSSKGVARESRLYNKLDIDTRTFFLLVNTNQRVNYQWLIYYELTQLLKH